MTSLKHKNPEINVDAEVTLAHLSPERRAAVLGLATALADLLAPSQTAEISPSRKLVSPREAGAHFGLSTTTIWRLVKFEGAPAKVIGNRRKIDLAAFGAWLEQRPDGAVAKPEATPAGFVRKAASK